MTHPLLPESCTLAFGWPGGTEWIILLVLGLLVFGRRLPDVGRNIGRSIVEFKKGIKGIEDDIDEESDKPSSKKRVEQTPPQQIEEKKATIGPEEDEAKAAAAAGEAKGGD